MNAKPLSRRKFGKTATATVVISGAPFIRSGKARARESADVVVIGSGLAGLNTAGILAGGLLSMAGSAFGGGMFGA